MILKRGFTLIELLVVISIIGILSSVVVTSLAEARTKARDAKRVAEIQQVRTALEMYYNGAGSYPQVGAEGNTVALSSLQTALAPFIPVLPADPLGGSFHEYNYTWADAGRAYAILVRLEADGSYSVTGQNLLSEWMSPSWWGSF